MSKLSMLALAVLAVLLITSTTNAQDDERKSMITPEQFVEKVSGMKIPGFSGRPEIETDVDDEFQATFLHGHDVVIIKLESRRVSPTWSASPYKLDGKDAEYVSMGGMGSLVVDLPETYSVLTIGSNKVQDKASLERIARETGLMQIAPASVAWPASVPEEYRIEGTLLEASEGEDFDTGAFSYQVRVTMVMSPLLKQSLNNLLGKFDGSEEVFVQFPDGTILNFPFHSIDEIDDDYPKDALIKFVYYIP